MTMKPKWNFITKELPIDTSNGYFITSQQLTDVLGFCFALQLLSEKTNTNIKANFLSVYSGIAKHFNGIIWTEASSLPYAKCCDAQPISDDKWVASNIIKRFYTHLDPTMQSAKPFDPKFRIYRPETKINIIGIITNSAQTGDMCQDSLLRIIMAARQDYPQARIVCIGDCKNLLLPCGVEDWRKSTDDLDQTIDTVKSISLLISPFNAQCLMAAAFGIPTWIYDDATIDLQHLLNFDTYKVGRWFGNICKTPLET